MLYLVATPIGNLADITFRAIEILKSSDLILCEDTRQSQILLHHYEIRKPLQSYHRFNEAKAEEDILYQLKQGKTISLISDAGTPGISDPGSRLVAACIAQDIPVVAIPGPCAAIQALVCSGLETDRFQFVGFLPKKSQELQHLLAGILENVGTTICYESPQRVADVLEVLNRLSPKRPIVLARELTKKFEEILRGTAQELLDHIQKQGIRGEIVLLIAGRKEAEGEEDWSHLSIADHVRQLQQTYHIPLDEAIKLAAKMRHVSKRIVYREIHCPDQSE